MSLRTKIKNNRIIGLIAVKMADFLRYNLKYKYNILLLFIRNKKTLEKNKELKNFERNKRIFVLGCGPSIGVQDLKPLANEVCISVSNFFVHPDYKIIKPKYHVFPQTHHPVEDDQYITWWKDAEKHFSDGQIIFIALADKYMVDQSGVFKKQQVHYYIDSNMEQSPSRDIDFSRALPRMGTVAHLAMYLALFLGSKEIDLLGIDINLLLHGVPPPKYHFYNDEESVLTQAGYQPLMAHLKACDVEVTFRGYLKLWKVYKFIKKYADIRNIKIINGSPQSMLDVFPQKDMFVKDDNYRRSMEIFFYKNQR